MTPVASSYNGIKLTIQVTNSVNYEKMLKYSKLLCHLTQISSNGAGIEKDQCKDVGMRELIDDYAENGGSGEV